MKVDKVTDSQLLDQVTPELKQAVQDVAADNRVTCAALLKLADDRGVRYGIVGAAADAAGVRVRSCELGCF